MYSRLKPTLATIALCACSVGDQPTSPTSKEVSTGSLTGASSARVTKPLSGRCSTVVARIAPPPIEMQRIEYTCQISHLGLTHAVVTQTVDVTTGALSSSGVFVAANGDQLNSDFSGTAVLSFTDPTEATVTFSGTEAFSPGTGRFADANGTAQLVGSARVNLITGAGTGEFTLQGTITY